MMNVVFKTHAGSPYPLGSTVTCNAGVKGVNFALNCRSGEEVTLCLFDKNGRESRLPMQHSSDGVWHIFVENISPGQRYGYRIAGNSQAGGGFYFNQQKLLLDPYAKAADNIPGLHTKDEVTRFLHDDSRDNARFAAKSIVICNDFSWENDQHPRTAWKDTIIYEMHVKGFSQLNPDIPEKIAGTFAALSHTENIRYLQALGITAVELLPISLHLDEPALQAAGKTNYWGYNVLAHFIPDTRYAGTDDVLVEFKRLVQTLHNAGIEVILDVVFNHSAENDIGGPMLCQRGIDNRQYYWVNERGGYIDLSGCGNSFNLSNPITLRWVMDCLRYWVEECHVDGFRFDLGSVLGRTPEFNQNCAFFAAVQQDPVLMGCKMIAEPWDIGLGGYNLGNFPQRFSEWNGRFRDDMRTFWLCNGSSLGVLAQRIAGSSDIFQHDYRSVRSSVNFITAHDGFNLRDLVSYNHKHNEENGEYNRDGENHNLSYNHGCEGETDNPAIRAERLYSRKALLSCLLLAHGVPMLFAGDEIGHTQQGNNNCYCQDNEISWLNWSEIDENLLKHVKKLTALRKQMAADSIYDNWWHDRNTRWLRPDGKSMQDRDWHDAGARALVLELQGKYLILFNGYRKSQTFVLPDGNWRLLLGDGLAMKASEATLAHLGVCVLSYDDSYNHNDSSEINK